MFYQLLAGGEVYPALKARLALKEADEYHYLNQVRSNAGTGTRTLAQHCTTPHFTTLHHTNTKLERLRRASLHYTTLS